MEIVIAVCTFIVMALALALNKKMLKRNLFENTFNKLVEDELVQLVKILSNCTKDYNYNEFNEILSNFRKGLLFYKFYDEKFYKNILGITMKIQDEVILSNSNKGYNEKLKSYWKVEKHLVMMFKLIRNYHNSFK